MSIVLRVDSAAATSHTLQRFGETDDGPLRTAEYNNLNQTGVTLASAKTVSLGLKLPKDLSKGTVLFPLNIRVPFANSAIGTPRFGLFVATAYLPADASDEERGIFRNNVMEVFNATEMNSLLRLLSTAI
jgi:hypothetical protein